MDIHQTWKSIRTTFVPLAMMIACPLVVLFSAKHGRLIPVHLTWTETLFGNTTSWTIAVIYIVWVFFFLKIPSKQYYGRRTPSGFTPRYQDNGLLYYVTSCLALIFAFYVYDPLPRMIYFNMPYLAATLNFIGFSLTLLLWFKGKFYPHEKQTEKVGFIFEFYCGVERNPRIFDVDVKQFTNVRILLMGWQLLLIAFWFFSYERLGLNWGITVNVILQSTYIGVCYWREVSYFITLDMIYEHAGFYFCWGGMAFVPCVYTSGVYYFIANPPTIDGWTALVVLVLGLVSVLFRNLVNVDRSIFRSSRGKRALWSSRPKFIRAEYETKDGTRQTKLLISGFWGVARHLNYVFEVFMYVVWCLPGYNLGVWPFVVPIFLFVFFVHRSLRDDEKCSKKYGAAWQQYCSVVKYKMIPYVF